MAKRQSRKRRDDTSRTISQLPNDILQHILSFLSPKDAIRTCVLSKTWRDLVSTRPNVDLRERRDKKKFVSLLEKTLQRYEDQKLPLQGLNVEMKSLDSRSSSILEKSVKNFNLKTLGLAFDYWQDFPPFIFEAESLEELHLTELKLTNQQLIDEKKVLFKHLKTLHLKNCYIEDEIFVNLMSSCPLIEYLVLEHVGSFCFNNHYPHLKSLYLGHMTLSADSFHNLPANNYFPCLEELELHSCSVLEEEFVLSSSSIKRLVIIDMASKFTIDAANILYLKVSNPEKRILPPSISLTTTSKEWKSHIDMCHFNHYGFANESWLRKVNELLKALSQSQIYFKPSYHELIHSCLILGMPPVVEHLDLSRCHTFTSYACFFRICRPKFMSGMCPNITAEIERHRLRRIEPCCSWQQDLEELSSEVWDHNAKEWHQVKLGPFSCSTLSALSDKNEIRYRLKWRGERTG